MRRPSAGVTPPSSAAPLTDESPAGEYPSKVACSDVNSRWKAAVLRTQEGDGQCPWQRTCKRSSATELRTRRAIAYRPQRRHGLWSSCRPPAASTRLPTRRPPSHLVVVEEHVGDAVLDGEIAPTELAVQVAVLDVGLRQEQARGWGRG